ncbi:hypothetical protein Tsubulata_021045 [Turnera subulata]|uniref:DUF4283 domain-containing protein n=1 Tax=Turnera subulata TaxID=218843 RepID=A0A9Q0FP99_9ROSI|nr:hypothetical protein Tsubulata_021045 [Turnera subulata]
MTEGIIRANLVRERRSTGPVNCPSKERLSQLNTPTVTRNNSYATVLKGVTPTPVAEVTKDSKAISFIPISDTLSWLSRCLVGTLKYPADRESVQHVWASHGYGEVKISDLGGDSILACFPSEASMLQFIQEEPEWVEPWFSFVKPWKRGDCVANRRCWLHVRGVPLHALCIEFFSLVGSFFGQLIFVDPATEQKERLDMARIDVLTTQGGIVEKALEVLITDSLYTICVVEEPKMASTYLFPDDNSSKNSDQGDQSQSPTVDVEVPVTNMVRDREARITESDGDPFGLMPVIAQSNFRGINGVTAAKKDSKRNISTKVDHKSNFMGDSTSEGKSLTNCHIEQIQENSDLDSNSNPIPIHNSFGLLMECEVIKTPSPRQTTYPQSSPTHNQTTPNVSHKQGSGCKGFSGSKGLQSSSTSSQYSETCSSSDSRYIQFLE